MGAEACSRSQLSGKRTGARTAGGGSGEMGGAAVVLGGGKVTGALARCSSVRYHDSVARRGNRPAEGG